MKKEEQIRKLSEVWLSAGKLLSFRIEAPYLLDGPDGNAALCVGYLPDFGGSNGTVVGVYSSMLGTFPRLISAAKSRKLFYSFINFEVYEKYDEEEFKRALNDWGYFGSENLRPSWMSSPR